MKGLNKKKLIEELTRDEGYRRKVYKDSVGIETIGIGRNLVDVGVTKEEAQYLLGNDIKTAVADAEKFSWYGCLSPARKRVIVNMIFNLGLPRFKRFKKTIKFAERGDYQGFSVEMLDSQWARQVGIRARRLSKMFREG